MDHAEIVNLNYYELLGVENNASTEEIKSAYKYLALKYHPDKTSTSSEVFVAVVKAYEILKDTTTRREYDSNLSARSYIPTCYTEVSFDEIELNSKSEYIYSCRCGDSIFISLDRKYDYYPCDSCGIYIKLSK